MPNFASLHVSAMEPNYTESLFLELAKIDQADGFSKSLAKTLYCFARGWELVSYSLEVVGPVTT